MKILKILIVIISLGILSIPNYGTSLGDSQTMKISGIKLSNLNIDSRNATTENLTLRTVNSTIIVTTGTILRKMEKH